MSLSAAGTMRPSPEREHWWATGASVQGQQHLRGSMPNQDSSGCQVGPAGRYAVGAVADGHGHAIGIRARQGSQLAVDVALREGAALGERLVTSDGPADVATESLRALPRLLAESWARSVLDHLAANPIDRSELTARDGLAAPDPETIERNPLLAYGTTLLLAVCAAGLVALAQIGDGAILTVAPDESVASPVPGDDRLVGSQTTSLASATASGEFRCALVRMPLLVMLATDGYVNSFATEDGFAEAARDIVMVARVEGLEVVERSLPDWLASTSREGSGDDASLALLVDREILGSGGKEET